jgi:hypothetical protein
MQWTIPTLVLLVAATPIQAGREADPLKETVKQVKAAIGKGDLTAAKAAFARAESLRPNYDDKKIAPLVQAIAKGVTHKDTQLALASVETVGKLRSEGSGKLLSALLRPPAKGKDEKMALHLAAIRATGMVHDIGSQKGLEKLLAEPRATIGVTAAEALRGYKALDAKPRFALMKRLCKTLDGLEKKIAKTKDPVARTGPERVRTALVETLGELSGGASATTAAEWKQWLKEAEKTEKES